MKKLNKFIALIVILVLTVINIQPVSAAKSSVSVNTKTIVEGKSATITIREADANGMIEADIKASGGVRVNVTKIASASNVATITVTGVTPGSGSVTITGFTLDPNGGESRISTTIDFNITRKSSSGSNSGTYNPSLPKGETEAEKAARLEREKAAQLAERQKNPLLESIDIISDSERNKGEAVASVKPVSESFEYSVDMPRNIKAFKLDIKAIADDVKYTVEDVYTISDTQDEIEVVIKAVQDEVSQEFKLIIKKYKESTISFEEGSLKLLEDKLIDKEMEKLGVKKTVVDAYYRYSYNETDFVLTYDDKGMARWYLVDENFELLSEVVIILDGDNKLRFLLDVNLEDAPTYNGGRYAKHSIWLPDSIVNLDSSLVFNNSISSWIYDENSFITHEYINPVVKTAEVDGEIEDAPVEPSMVLVSNEGVVTKAFVAFDSGNSLVPNLITYIFIALWLFTLLIYFVDKRRTNRKIDSIMSRRQY